MKKIFIKALGIISGVTSLKNALLPLSNLYWSQTLKRYSKSSKIMPNVKIFDPQFVSISDRVYIGHGTFIYGKGEVNIGRDVLIAADCTLMTRNHRILYVQPINQQGFDYSPITLEDDVWLGTKVIILPGVTLARGTVVAAGAVVTKSTEPYSIVAGVPAKKIGSRKA